jgi:hypothetical protein
MRTLELRPGRAVEAGAPPVRRAELDLLRSLACLLGFSLVLLPGLQLLGRARVERLAGLLARPGGLLLLPALPVPVVEVALGGEVGHGGWNHASYALFLAYGFLAAADRRIGQAFARHWRPAMALAGLLFAACGAVYAAASAHGDPLTASAPLAMTFRTLKSLDGWLWVLAILGLAQRRGARPGTAPGRAGPVRRLGAYANEAVLPFYLLYELGVRRSRLARSLLGLRPRPGPGVTSSGGAAPAAPGRSRRPRSGT